MSNKRGHPKKIDTSRHNEKIPSKKTEEDLIAEVERLRAENAYLKKYNALV